MYNAIQTQTKNDMVLCVPHQIILNLTRRKFKILSQVSNIFMLTEFQVTNINKANKKHEITTSQVLTVRLFIIIGGTKHRIYCEARNSSPPCFGM